MAFYESGVAGELSEPELSFLIETVGSCIDMAKLEPGSSVSDLGIGSIAAE